MSAKPRLLARRVPLVLHRLPAARKIHHDSDRNTTLPRNRQRPFARSAKNFPNRGFWARFLDRLLFFSLFAPVFA
ncbi:hypothetical protein EJP67_02205 [Variovorax guangxiensis]|uniref:Uncharacterized protein n=1 Tax=Variovorax guangxiensis TaxID=1775474 RepID=A0A433MDC8_9BURK|nr:hypothetical protein [Variovorax guangxiensis]RUR65866.1 hypothetical protein EJP67_02205 [Variovorax guangxiensis]